MPRGLQAGSSRRVHGSAATRIEPVCRGLRAFIIIGGSIRNKLISNRTPSLPRIGETGAIKLETGREVLYGVRIAHRGTRSAELLPVLRCQGRGQKVLRRMWRLSRGPADEGIGPATGRHDGGSAIDDGTDRQRAADHDEPAARDAAGAPPAAASVGWRFAAHDREAGEGVLPGLWQRGDLGQPVQPVVLLRGPEVRRDALVHGAQEGAVQEALACGPFRSFARPNKQAQPFRRPSSISRVSDKFQAPSARAWRPRRPRSCRSPSRPRSSRPPSGQHPRPSPCRSRPDPPS